jgi:hypothetical protein
MTNLIKKWDEAICIGCFKFLMKLNKTKAVDVVSCTSFLNRLHQ